MTINHNKENNTLTISVIGRLDTVTSPELDDFIFANLEGVKTLIFDLKDLEYTSSSGLRIFLKGYE